MKITQNKIISGIQPTGSFTLGNYLGSVTMFTELQEETDLILFVADLHALTTNNHDVAKLSENSINIVRHYLASGVNSQKNHFFVQSQIPEHTELHYILTCISTIGELSRMTQFKTKANIAQPNKTETIPTGLLVYPLLMAADILLYKVKYVPVGDDQLQHLELIRNIAIRFNKKYGDTFTIPEAWTNKVTSRIMDLQDPNKKMSKSSAETKGVIFLLDPIEVSLKKLKAAITDDRKQITYDKIKQPGIANLINIYVGLKNSPFVLGRDAKKWTVENVIDYHKNDTYAQFKCELIKIASEFLTKYQERYKQINDVTIGNLIKNGADHCQKIARETLKEVKTKIGLLQ